VTYFLRNQINNIANGADDILSQYLPQNIADSIRGMLPVIMSGLAMYFGIMSFWRTARGTIRFVISTVVSPPLAQLYAILNDDFPVSRTGFTLFKYGFIAFLASTAYSFYQGNGTQSLQNSYGTATSSLAAASSLIGPLGTVATWWIGRENIDTVKRFAAQAGFPVESFSTAPKKGKASSGSGWADAFAPGEVKDTGKKAGKKAEKQAGGLFDSLAGMMGGQGGEDVVKNFVNQATGGGDAGSKFFDMAKAAMGDDGSNKKKKQ
jgi:hypothetical protein